VITLSKSYNCIFRLIYSVNSRTSLWMFLFCFCWHWVFITFYSDPTKQSLQLWILISFLLTNRENSWSLFLSSFLFRRLSGKSSGQSGFDGKTRKMITDANADNKTGFICNSLNLQLNLQLKLLIVITVIKAVYCYHIGIYV
jgi:hypothetical protein